MTKEKIISLFKDEGLEKKENMLKVLKDMIKDVEEGKVVRFAIAAALDNGDIATGWANCGITQRQELVSHLQVDIFYKVVYTNLVGDE